METADAAQVRALLGRTYEEKAKLTEKLRKRLAPQKYLLFEETEMYHPQIFSLRKQYLAGYWACEAYYADIMGLLRQEIRFPKSEDERNRAIMEEMQSRPSVSIRMQCSMSFRMMRTMCGRTTRGRNTVSLTGIRERTAFTTCSS